MQDSRARLEFIADPAIPHEDLNSLLKKRIGEGWSLHKILEFNVEGVIPMVTLLWERTNDS